jgi:hypothetical protein
MSKETEIKHYWLLEGKVSKDSPPRYIRYKYDYMTKFTYDVTLALKFATEEEANAYSEYCNLNGDYTAIEHGFHVAVKPTTTIFIDGVPCEHPGCMRHITHPCEECGRIMGFPKAYYEAELGRVTKQMDILLMEESRTKDIIERFKKD